MKIGVVSDTHSKRLPAQMLRDFKKMDLVIHAGDFCEMADYQGVAKLGPLKAVYGNMDAEDVRQLLPRKQILSVGRYRIGLFHGEGPPATLLEKVRSQFAGDEVDAVIFGHSHQPLNQDIDGVLFFNPGSPNDEVFAPYRSYGILEVTDQGITGKLVRVKD